MHAEILVIRFINLHSYKHEKANIDQSNFTLRLQIKKKSFFALTGSGVFSVC